MSEPFLREPQMGDPGSGPGQYSQPTLCSDWAPGSPTERPHMQYTGTSHSCPLCSMPSVHPPLGNPWTRPQSSRQAVVLNCSPPV